MPTNLGDFRKLVYKSIEDLYTPAAVGEDVRVINLGTRANFSVYVETDSANFATFNIANNKVVSISGISGTMNYGITAGGNLVVKATSTEDSAVRTILRVYSDPTPELLISLGKSSEAAPSAYTEINGDAADYILKSGTYQIDDSIITGNNITETFTNLNRTVTNGIISETGLNSYTLNGNELNFSAGIVKEDYNNFKGDYNSYTVSSTSGSMNYTGLSFFNFASGDTFLSMSNNPEGNHIHLSAANINLSGVVRFQNNHHSFTTPENNGSFIVAGEIIGDKNLYLPAAGANFDRGTGVNATLNVPNGLGTIKEIFTSAIWIENDIRLPDGSTITATNNSSLASNSLSVYGAYPNTDGTISVAKRAILLNPKNNPHDGSVFNGTVNYPSAELAEIFVGRTDPSSPEGKEADRTVKHTLIREGELFVNTSTGSAFKVLQDTVDINVHLNTKAINASGTINAPTFEGGAGNFTTLSASGKTTLSAGLDVAGDTTVDKLTSDNIITAVRFATSPAGVTITNTGITATGKTILAGTFSGGSFSGSTGTFSGAVSVGSLTSSGSVSGTTGTFSSTLTGQSIVSNTTLESKGAAILDSLTVNSASSFKNDLSVVGNLTVTGTDKGFRSKAFYTLHQSTTASWKQSMDGNDLVFSFISAT